MSGWCNESKPISIESIGWGSFKQKKEDIMKQWKVLYLGPKRSFSEIATKEWIKNRGKKNAEKNVFETFLLCPQRSISKVFTTFYDWIARGIYSATSIVPVENSTEGSVNTVLDELVGLEGKIVVIGEIVLNIRQNLITTQGATLQDIKTVYSHPQGIAQTRGWLQKHLPEVELVEVSSTSKGAQIVAEKKDPTIAAIGSKEVANLPGLKILMKNINDSSNNKTRFIVLGQSMPRPTGHDKTSLTFTIQNEPGSLLRVLEVFDVYNINMCKMESRPTKKGLGLYRFFVDIDGHQSDEKLSAALKIAKEKCQSFKTLGSYPVAEED